MKKTKLLNEDLLMGIFLMLGAALMYFAAYDIWDTYFWMSIMSLVAGIISLVFSLMSFSYYMNSKSSLRK